MRILFCAAVDAISCGDSCACEPWLRAAAEADAPQRKPRRGADPAAIAFPPPAHQAALVAALARGVPGSGDDRPDGWADFPVAAWQTPDGVELGVSTLCPAVRAALAANDEPAAVAHADGGWRRPLSVFRFSDGLADVRIRPRSPVPWRAFADLREVLLDALSDRRQPLLARLAEIAGIVAVVVDQKAVPAELPPLTARKFLAWRGFLEARVASAASDQLAAFGESMRPLFAEDAGLIDVSPAEFAQALAGDWRAHLHARVAPQERAISDALETWLGCRLFALPLDRDVSFARGAAEFFESFALGIRFLAALCAARGCDADPATAVAAMAMGEHMVGSAGTKLTSFTLPPATPGRAPRLVDVDMTLGSIS